MFTHKRHSAGIIYNIRNTGVRHLSLLAERNKTQHCKNVKRLTPITRYITMMQYYNLDLDTILEEIHKLHLDEVNQILFRS